MEGIARLLWVGVSYDVMCLMKFLFPCCCVCVSVQDRASQIAAIEATFESAKKPVSEAVQIKMIWRELNMFFLLFLFRS